MQSHINTNTAIAPKKYTTSFAPQNDKRKTTDFGQTTNLVGVYTKSILTKKVVISITEFGNNVKQILEDKINLLYENRCIAEGFIKPNSIKVITYSAANIQQDKLGFQVVFECMLCNPVEGMIIQNCKVKTITKAGIHAEVITDDDVVPINVFIARDHHNLDRYFNSIKENATVTVQVIGVRYELNDSYICVIGELVQNSENNVTG
jgi:DNA-directed RNA polymerase subunit E'/Rpb7